MPYAVDYYMEIGDILGQGGVDYCIVPAGDARFENPARTTVTSVGSGAGDGLIFTYTPTARPLWSASTRYEGRGDIAFLPGDFGVALEYVTTPDVAFFTTTAGNAFSIGGMARIGAGKLLPVFCKWTEQTGSEDREFRLSAGGDPVIVFDIYDETNNALLSRRWATGLNLDRVYAIGGTYDGGTDAVNLKIYIDGMRRDNSTLADDAGFVSMVNGATPAGNFYRVSTNALRTTSGWVAGSACGLYFTKRLLSDQDERKICILQREALNDLPPINRMRGLR